MASTECLSLKVWLSRKDTRNERGSAQQQKSLKSYEYDSAVFCVPPSRFFFTGHGSQLQVTVMIVYKQAQLHMTKLIHAGLWHANPLGYIAVQQ